MCYHEKYQSRKKKTFIRKKRNPRREYNENIEILRELAKKVARLAVLDEQKELIKLWKKQMKVK